MVDKSQPFQKTRSGQVLERYSIFELNRHYICSTSTYGLFMAIQMINSVNQGTYIPKNVIQQLFSESN